MDGEIGEPYNFFKLLRKNLKMYWKNLVVIFWPLVLLPILMGADSGPEGAKFRCMYVVLIMAGFWVTECTSLYVTGFLPVFMFPLLNIMSSVDVAVCYFKEVTMMFMGSMFLATAIETSNLHIRIALFVIRVIGTKPRQLHFAILYVSFFLSMWLMNTAVAAMMCPIIKAVQEELESQGIGTIYEPQTPEEIETQTLPRPSGPTTAYFLGVCYSANIGGLATLIGTGTTMVYKGLIDDTFPLSEGAVEFGSWFGFAFPAMLVVELITWFWLQVVFFGLFRPNSKAGQYVALANERQEVAKSAINEKYEALGKISWHESWVGVMFCLTIALWTFRKPDFMEHGWAEYFTADYQTEKKYLRGSVPSTLIIFLMLLIPSKKDFLYMFSKDPEKRPKTNSPSLVTWKAIQVKTAWGLLFLLGGGFALASGGNKTGMSSYIGHKLDGLKSIDKYLVMFITTFITSVSTEIVSNMACCNVLMPILLSISVTMKVNPVLFGNTGNMAASYAFMLPVGTTTNAVVASYSNARTIDFVIGGSVVKLASYLVTCFCFITYGRIFWSIDTFPEWANIEINTTTTTVLPPAS